MKLTFYIISILYTSLSTMKDTTSNETIELGQLLEPEPVGFSFSTPGWHIIAVIVIILLLVFFYQWVSQYRKDAFRREAIKSILLIEKRYKEKQDANCVNDILVVLKLVAIESFGRENVAQLNGEDWLLFLENKADKTPFGNYSEQISQFVNKEIEVPKNDVERIIAISKRWIKTHA